MADNEKISVLIVEDEAAHADAIRYCLLDSRYDFSVKAVTTLSEGRCAMSSNPPDILLLDLHLPDGNAMELLSECNTPCPVLIMTAQGNEETAVKAMKAGAIDYIVKSSEVFASIPRTIERALREWRLLKDNEKAIDDLRKSEQQLRKLSLAVEQSPAAVLITNLDGTIEYVNPKFTEVTGYSFSEAIGENPRILKSGQMENIVYRQLWAHLLVGDQWQGELLNRHKAGHLFWERAQISPMRNELGEVTHYIAIKEDITVQKNYEKQLEHMATHDELTGLANRALFKNLLDSAIVKALRSDHQVAVILLDLDRFKIINDSLGHTIGDELLCLVAQRLKQAVRESDTVVRFGGDEFVVLLPEVNSAEKAGLVATKILNTLALPYRLGEREVIVTASLGLSMAPVDGSDSLTLIRNADIAMYQSKSRGGEYSFYSNEMNRYLLESLDLENDLRRALKNNEFHLHYQAKVDLNSGRICGCEALLRWQHPHRGMVPPGDFIPLTEETGMIVPIGTWVMEEACRQSLAWQAAGLKPIRIAVNLSARQFGGGNLAKNISRILQNSGLDGSLLELELTESMVMNDPQGAVETLQQLKGLGVALSLDDFGTGFSSLNYLRRFPVDSLKIDKSFIHDVAVDVTGASVVTSIIDIAHNLGLTAIAEGVETRGQYDFLVANGCDAMQGYFFSKPLPAQEFELLLREEKCV